MSTFKAAQIAMAATIKALNKPPREPETCPFCGSAQITLHEYYNGEDWQTGYVDAGVMVRCHDCGRKAEL